MKLSAHLPVRYILSGLLFTAFVSQVQAAPLNLIPGNPNITTSGTAVNYVFDGSGSNTLTITGTAGSGLPSQQSITIPGGNSNGGGSNAAISGNATGAITPGSYVLTANFDNFGAFLDGTVSVGGYVVNGTGFTTSDPEAYFTGTNSGTVLAMDLVDFGFSGTQTQTADSDSVILEWAGLVTASDLAVLGFADGGVIASGIVTWGTGSGSYGASWDQAAFTSSFASSGPLLVGTYVPVPAAVWLFGSGLLGLVGVGIRRRSSAG